MVRAIEMQIIFLGGKIAWRSSDSVPLSGEYHGQGSPAGSVHRNKKVNTTEMTLYTHLTYDEGGTVVYKISKASFNLGGLASGIPIWLS